MIGETVFVYEVRTEVGAYMLMDTLYKHRYCVHPVSDTHCVFILYNYICRVTQSCRTCIMARDLK